MNKRLVVYLGLLPFYGYANTAAIEKDIVSFAQSFVTTLSVAPEGRFSREYHPYLLQKTMQSLGSLEEAIRNAGMHCSERISLMGYEQNAIPNYGYCLTTPAFTDEAVVKSSGGWSFSPGNIFGYLTGFLLKDAVAIPQQVVHHQLAEKVELFNPHTESLQEHAFGPSYRMIMHHHGLVTESMLQKNPRGILQELIAFWERIYEQDTVTQTGIGAATQDILFSLFYAKHLLTNTIPLTTIFTGPDITYPITVSAAQSLEATQNAQWFVKYFCQQLVPRHTHKTAYIFCSFVDGVGKSTMLGNVQNYRKYGTDFSAYEQVNNSSSQTGTLYAYDDNVVIVDLPAQLSHFTPKPDGQVFVDIGYCPHIDAALTQQLHEYVQQHAAACHTHVLSRLEELQQGATPTKTIIDAVLSNCVTLGVEPTWIPFRYGDTTFAFAQDNPTLLRVCVPFAQAPSQGLKIPEPELMIFDQGLFIPMSYDSFMQDLVNQLQQAGVKEVVFVDFMSMYPRSSRETVRINYLLQHLKRYYREEFDLHGSIGAHMAHRQALYGFLFEGYDTTERSLYVETLLRWILHTLIADASAEGLTVIDDENLQRRVQEKIALLHTAPLQPALAQIRSCIQGKLHIERQQYEHYEYGAFYQAVLTNSWTRLAECTEWHTDTIAKMHPDKEIQQVWQSTLGPVVQWNQAEQTVTVEGGATLQVVQQLPSQITEDFLQRLMDNVRPLWMDQLLGIFMPQQLQGRYQETLVIKLLPTKKYAICAVTHEQYSGLQAMTMPRNLYTWGITQQSAYMQESEYEQGNLLSRVAYALRQKFCQDYNEMEESFIVAPEHVLAALQMESNSTALWMPSARSSRMTANTRNITLDSVTLTELASLVAKLYSYCKSPTDLLMIRHRHASDLEDAALLFAHYVWPMAMNGL